MAPFFVIVVNDNNLTLKTYIKITNVKIIFVKLL